MTFWQRQNGISSLLIITALIPSNPAFRISILSNANWRSRTKLSCSGTVLGPPLICQHHQGVSKRLEAFSNLLYKG